MPWISDTARWWTSRDAVYAGEVVDLAMGFFKRDLAGRRQQLRAPQPRALLDAAGVLNVTGPERISVREIAQWFGSAFGRPPRFANTEGQLALLSDSSRCRAPSSASPQLPLSVMRNGWPTGYRQVRIAQQADALRSGGWPLLIAPMPCRAEEQDVGSRTAARAAQRLVIPAHSRSPLTEARRLDDRGQGSPLTRYYCDAGAGGIAGRRPHDAVRHSRSRHPVVAARFSSSRPHGTRLSIDRRVITVAGVCGPTAQAIAEAELAASFDYDAALVSLAALGDEDNGRVLDHCRRVSDVIPVMGFYLQPAVGGRVLDRAFWPARFLEIERVVAIKGAPFDRYRTLDCRRSRGRERPPRRRALYGQRRRDRRRSADAVSRLAPLSSGALRGGKPETVHFSGGLLGQWAVWTKNAVELASPGV